MNGVFFFVFSWDTYQIFIFIFKPQSSSLENLHFFEAFLQFLTHVFQLPRHLSSHFHQKISLFFDQTTPQRDIPTIFRI